MRFHVAQLLREPVGATRDFVVDESPKVLGPDVTAISSVRGSVRLLRTGRGVLASGSLATRVRLTCSRCLSDVDQDVRFAFDEEFRPTLDLATGLPLPPAEPGEEGSLIDEHHILDVSDVARQSALLALPMKPLCSESCPGLCPECGQRRDGACRCAAGEDTIASEGPLAPGLRAWLARHQGRRREG